MGVNMLTLSPGAERRGPTSVSAPPLSMGDAQAIAREVSAVSAVAPSSARGALAVFANKNWSTSVTGTNNAYFEVRNLKIDVGRMFSDVELQSGTPACVIGATVKRELFGHQDAIGAAIRLGKLSCVVVGTVVSKGQSTFGMDQDDFILMPLTAFQRRLAGNTEVSSISVSAVSEAATVKAKSQIEMLMRERRKIAPGQADDFSVRDMKEIAQTLQTVTGALTALLGAVAAVSLLVGGIGIMNIMLVSVTERTREIGIRLAIGARGHEVLLQFLVEAVVLSTLGGIIGMILGLGGSFAAGRALGLPFRVMPEVVVIAFAFSATVGVAFGFFPARKAARLNPIEALRHE
jgi:putative ABC transport system permease protein